MAAVKMKTIVTEDHPHHVIYCSDEAYEELSQHKWVSEQRGGKVYAVNQYGRELLLNAEVENAS